MKVYIVRHGKAENESASRRDVDRALTPRGIEQARFLGGQMARGTTRPALIVSSPVTRALETARIIHSYLHVRFDTADALRVDEPVSGAVDLLTTLAYPAQGPAVECLVLVGHNPQVSELCEVLVNGIGTSQFLFRTGEAMLLEVNRASLIGSGRLLAQIRHDEEECAAPSGV
jgi:phosphohistidine phosphatase